MANLRKRNRKNNANGSFNDIPEELLELIFEFLWQPRKNIILGATIDFIRISAVCKKWQRASSRVNKQSGIVGPLIFVPAERKNGRSFHLYDFSSDLDQQLRLPSTRDRRFINSWNEWLVTAENRKSLLDSDYGINFYNMFSGAYIQLPQASCLHNPYNRSSTWMIKKAVASCSPLDPNCNIMVVSAIEFKLAFYNIGDKKWEIFINKFYLLFHDLIYFKDEFYVVTEHGHMFVCDLKCVKLKTLTCSDSVDAGLGYNYLVEISGDLFRIKRQIHPQNVRLFMVYKMDFSARQWQVVNSFGGDNSVFIGHNKSICISANDLQIQSDCIYFNDNRARHDMKEKNIRSGIGVFDMKTKLVVPSFPPSRRWPSQFWVTKV